MEAFPAKVAEILEIDRVKFLCHRHI